MEFNIVSWNARMLYSVVRKAESNSFSVVATHIRHSHPTPKLPPDVKLITKERWEELLKQSTDIPHIRYEVISDMSVEDQLNLQSEIQGLYYKIPKTCPAAMFACVIAAIFNGSLASIHETARKTEVFRRIYQRTAAILEPYVDKWESAKLESLRRDAQEVVETETETDGD